MRYLALAPALLMASPAVAEVGLTLALPAGAEVSSQLYDCGAAGRLAVRYINADPDLLAVLPVEGQERIFVNVISGSGARYASGQYVWWAKGDTAMLLDEMTEGSQTDCTAVK